MCLHFSGKNVIKHSNVPQGFVSWINISFFGNSYFILVYFQPQFFMVFVLVLHIILIMPCMVFLQKHWMASKFLAFPLMIIIILTRCIHLYFTIRSRMPAPFIFAVLYFRAKITLNCWILTDFDMLEAPHTLLHQH